ncbi:MAG: effector binding domain-containing protein [Defluviitaleaceae bacterium]|nr:effector binding domain-containing protein [Defluviitaleaceae bacterium]MCL2273586.1 effector binding domain-containing protein [Defluviitaleaceae bacterium]
MLRIGEVAKMYGISNRTLRHWEDVGVLKSTRAENGYRFYDEENAAKIRQIVLLRKLKMPITDIERIFIADSHHIAVSVLTDYLESLKYSAATYTALAALVASILGNIQKIHNLQEMFALLEAQHTPQISLARRITKMKNVRIMTLPPMRVAAHHALSETPEKDCALVFDKFVLDNNLHKRSGHRSFGFNNPDPSEGNSIYGYELWVTVPDDFTPPAPMVIKTFDGGLYASISTQMNEIGERWDALYNWSTENEKYEGDFARQWLEEQVMDYATFMSDDVPDSEKQLDLLLPIKVKG